MREESKDCRSRQQVHDVWVNFDTNSPVDEKKEIVPEQKFEAKDSAIIANQVSVLELTLSRENKWRSRLKRTNKMQLAKCMQAYQNFTS